MLSVVYIIRMLNLENLMVSKWKILTHQSMPYPDDIC